MSGLLDRLAAVALGIGVLCGARAWWVARDPVVYLTPGDAVPITGLVAPEDRERLVFAAPRGVTFELLELRTDTWLGRPEWRGALTATAGAEGGALRVNAGARDYPPVPIVIGAGPGPESALAAVGALLVGIALGAAGWAAERRRVRGMLAEGRADVLLRRVEGGATVLGFAELPVAVGEHVRVLGPDGELGDAVVTEVSDGAALARLAGTAPAGPLRVARVGSSPP